MKALDLKHFKKVKTEADHTIMEHPDGHTIKINHSSLKDDEKKALHSLPHAKMEKKPKGYAQGGSVRPESVADQLASAEAGQVPLAESPASVPLSMQGSADTTADTAGAIAGQLQQDKARASAPVPENALAQAAGVAPKLESEALIKGLEATNQTGQLQSKAAESEAKLMGQQAKAQEAKLQGEQQFLQKAQQHWETWTKDAMEHPQQVNPTRYLDNMSTGQRITTALGMLISGLGGNSGEHNSVVKFINNQIDNDIKAQEKDISNKQNMLKLYMDEFGGIMQGKAAYRAHSLEVAKMRLEELVKKNASPQAIANAQAGMAALTQAAAKSIGEGAMAHAKFSSLTGGGAQGTEDQHNQMLETLRLADPARAKEIEGRTLPGVGVATKAVPDKEASAITARRALDEQMTELIEFAQKNQGSLDLSVINQGKALAAQVQDGYRKANQQGVFKESENQFVQAVVDSDPTKFFAEFRTLPKYRQAQEVNKNELANAYKAFGVKPFAGGQQERVQGANGKWYIKVPGGYKPAN